MLPLVNGGAIPANLPPPTPVWESKLSLILVEFGRRPGAEALDLKNGVKL